MCSDDLFLALYTQSQSRGHWNAKIEAQVYNILILTDGLLNYMPNPIQVNKHSTALSRMYLVGVIQDRIPGGWINIKMSSYQYRKSHCGDKTIVIHNGITYAGKTTSLYWIGVQDIIKTGMSLKTKILISQFDSRSIFSSRTWNIGRWWYHAWLSITFKLGYGLVITSHTKQWVWLFIDTLIKGNPCEWKGPQVFSSDVNHLKNIHFVHNRVPTKIIFCM